MGVKKLTGGPTRTRLPITLPLLAQLQEAWQASVSTKDTSMLWAAATMCFFGFLRVGEVVTPSDLEFNLDVHLSAADVSVDSHSSPLYVAVTIKASKTDPFRRGVTIYLGRTRGTICLVVATLKYMVERDLSKGPLFRFENGRVLTRERFVTAVREALTTKGVDSSKYCGHSFHIGAAKTAVGLRIQDSLVRTMGRWESSAYLLYIWMPRDTICSVVRTLLGAICVGVTSSESSWGADILTSVEGIATVIVTGCTYVHCNS